MARDFDLILQGATGFTGHLAAETLSRCAPAGFRWAVAGRDPTRTTALAHRYDIPAVIADGMDAEANARLAAHTGVVISCAGPFSRYGQHLAEACVEQGTHYADISGELPWIEHLQQHHHARCCEKGIAMIPAAGFDSVPSDLAVMAMREDHGHEIPLHGFFQLRGGFNGGTLFSGIALAEDHSGDAVPHATRGRGVFPVPPLARWATPFLMAPVNEHVVARSDRLRMATDRNPEETGPYREAMAVRGRMQAHGVRFVLRCMEGMFGSRLGRSLLQRFGPSPGEGPSEEDIQAGFARLTILAGPLDAPLAMQTWHWHGDPSNRITVHCLVQTGLALATGELQAPGVVTPSVGLGPSLYTRLERMGAVVNRTPAAS